MDPRDPRFSRQERLREVGLAGQERILRHSAVVRGVEGADVEVAYLAAAGVGEVRRRSEERAAPFAHAARFEFSATRDVGAGAWRALAELKRALGIG